MKKYYVLLLNNCYDIKENQELPNPCSVLPNILVKEYTKLTKKKIEKDFLGYDDTITIDKFAWIVKGSYPVIAEEIDGKIYDIVTKKEIKYSKDKYKRKVLSYNKKYLVDKKVVKILLKLLDESSIERYAKGLEKLEEYTLEKYKGIEESEKYYIVTPNDNGVLLPLLITKEINGQIIDILTNKKIYPSSERKITSNLNYTIKNKISKEKALSLPIKVSSGLESAYRKDIERAKMNSARRYNDYILRNENKNFEDRIELESKVPMRIRKPER